MYTLLITDDEFYTRQGIINMLPLEDLRISKVIEADDGVNALEKINSCAPDIVLTDVRMPRMNGIDMALEIRKKYPNCIIIFMSGYSDKEYLRAAIKLRAIQYVDKPIVMDELIYSLREAVQICDEFNKSTEIISDLNRNELALELTHKHITRQDLDIKIEAANLVAVCSSKCITIVLRVFPEQNTDLDGINLIQQSILNKTDKLFDHFGLTYVRGYKNTQNLIIHLIHDTKHQNQTSSRFISKILMQLSEILTPYPHFISVGVPAKNLYNLYKSYTTAVLNLQDNFFIGANTITFFSDESKPVYIFDNRLVNAFEEYLLRKDFNEAKLIINNLTANFSKHNGTLISNVKNAFFCLILRLLQIASSKHVNVFLKLGTEQYIWEIISYIYTLKELNDFSLDCLNIYIDALDEDNKSSNIVSIMKNYIETNSSSSDLTIDLISTHLHLTPSYLCLIFKQDTGKTINQYITECRIDKAKKYLKDVRIKISDAGLKSGYEDNNYFAKVFRKHTGLSPSEYREGAAL